MVRIIDTRSREFTIYARDTKGLKAEQVHSNRAGEVSDCPEWIKHTEDFKRGVASGEIDVLKSRTQTAEAEARAAGRKNGNAIRRDKLTDAGRNV